MGEPGQGCSLGGFDPPSPAPSSDYDHVPTSNLRRALADAQEAAQKTLFGAQHKTLTPVVGLPTDDAARKALPIWTGVVLYFPDVMLAVAHVSKLGNDQHNPGEPLHWAREKSTDQLNTAARHMLDHSLGNVKDTDGSWHLAKAIWRLSAELQLAIEKERA